MISFAQYQQTQLYIQQPDSGPGFLAFFLAVSPGNLPAGITIQESWDAYRGFYLFLKARPANLDAFVAAVGPYLAPFDPAHTGLSWVNLSGADERPGRVEVLEIEPGLQGGAQVQKGLVLTFANYRLAFAAGTPVVPLQDQASAIVGLAFEYPPFHDSPPPLAAGGLRVPLAGAGRGCLQGEAMIGDFSDDPHTGWNVGCRYFLKTSATSDTLASQYYPVFKLEEGVQVLFQLTWDPLDQLNPDRTFLAFSGTSFKLVQAGGFPPTFALEALADPDILGSYFLTSYGKPIGLRPLTSTRSPNHPARLVFAGLPTSTEPLDQPERYYLVPSGDFELIASGAKVSARAAEVSDPHLLCGLSGVESIGFGADGAVLSFWPGQAAFAPIFPLTNGSAGARVGPLLSADGGRYTTAWAIVNPLPEAQQPAPIIYYAQSEGAPLYGGDTARLATGAAASAPTDFLSFSTLPAAQFPRPVYPPPPSGPYCFPIVPLAGATPGAEMLPFGPDFLKTFEYQIVNPARRQQIERFPAFSPVNLSSGGRDVEPIYGTTPQGLLVTVAGFAWSELLLAHTTTQGGAVEKLAFTNLNTTLQAAFQTNQQFLVISWDHYLKADGTGFSRNISIGGWSFELNVPSDATDDYKNVLIFKFCEDTLQERVQDPKLWTNPAAFNQDGDDNLEQLSIWLADYIEQAIKQADDPAFTYFAGIATNPAWNGILALNVTVKPEGMPPELQGLLAGIDLDRFAAHHLGIELNYVQPANGKLEMAAQSSLFGLINYEDAEQPDQRGRPAACPNSVIPPEPGDTSPPYYETPYDFKVLTLRVLFANSEIADFNSTVNLTLNNLFGEAVVPEDPEAPDNVIMLSGSYENHSGTRAYVFRSEDEHFYGTYGRVVQSVNVIKVQFSTRVNDSGGAGKQAINAIFSIWGNLAFYNVDEKEKAFDLFSFELLSFSGLLLHMNFDLSNPGERTFAFDPAPMAFDLANSQARPNSLFRNFPLQLSAMVYGDSNGRPDDQGYLPILTPLTQSTTLFDQWFALQFDLNLGTPGALATRAGFTASILAAWSPSYDELEGNSISVNLELPRGGEGKHQLVIQDVLRLSIERLEFLTTATDSGGVAYILLFKRIALRVLGKNIPSNSRYDIILFGNPDPNAPPGSLGWYFAYNPGESARGGMLPRLADSKTERER